mgnify:CR=1 FL=1
MPEIATLYDEKQWEQMVLHWLHIRAGAENVQWVSPHAGGNDDGMDILIRSLGIAYQCYAPQKWYAEKDLYEKQRTKMTDDGGKLITKKKDIEKNKKRNQKKKKKNIQRVCKKKLRKKRKKQRWKNNALSY